MGNDFAAYCVDGVLTVHFGPLDAAYLAGYRATTAGDIRAGFEWARPFGHGMVLAFAQGANAFAVADRYGVDLSAAVVEREQT